MTRTEDRWGAVWQRVRSGAHTAIIGAGAVPAGPSDLKVLRLKCDAASATHGLVFDACLRMEEFLGEGHLFYQEAGKTGPTKRRLRLFEDTPIHLVDAVFVDRCNRLADATDGHATLLFESADAADEGSLEILSNVVGHSGWLRLPLVFTLNDKPHGATASLVETLRGQGGGEAIIQIDDDTPAGPRPVPYDWSELPSEVLRVLRAGSVLGRTFGANVVAQLLDEPLGLVFEKLQYAADAGAPLADRGEGVFSLSAQSVEALQRNVLPSLLTFWHAQLGELLGGKRQPRASAAPDERVIRSARRAPEATAGLSSAEREMPGRAPDTKPGGSSGGSSPTDFAELFEPTSTPAHPGPDSAPGRTGATVESRSHESQPADARERQDAGGGALGSGIDKARAAAHLQAAGRTEAAVEEYVDAIREAAARGHARQAHALGQEALKLLDALPTSDRRALLRTRVSMEIGRLQWRGAVIGRPFTLQDALKSVKDARSSLPHAVPADVVGELAALTAGVCYDLGDLTSLQEALDELTDVSRRLIDAGQSTLAAGLLNEQAAIYARLGDPVRASHLLSKSRDLFSELLRQQPEDSTIAEELAETDHLLARLVLHARIRPGMESDAYARCLDHARDAERAFRRLGQPRQLARVWETMGRIELERGQLEAADARLSKALKVQREVGDVTGLARSTAALAELLIKADRLGEALPLLGSSLDLNLEKGSPIGLAFNRKTLEALSEVMRHSGSARPEPLQSALREVENKLSMAESVLGRSVLPSES